MQDGRKARDVALIDALDRCERTAFKGVVWRAVREGRDPIQGQPTAGRWDPGTFDVLYTALEPDGALAEISFHLSRQPVFPSKIQFVLHEISVQATKTLKFESLEALEPLGVEKERYPEILYSRTQEIGDAADFLGFDGVIAPNARWRCLNLILFTDRLDPEDLEVITSEPADIRDWTKRR
jgi:hypothetical protein